MAALEDGSPLALSLEDYSKCSFDFEYRAVSPCGTDMWALAQEGCTFTIQEGEDGVGEKPAPFF